MNASEHPVLLRLVPIHWLDILRGAGLMAAARILFWGAFLVFTPIPIAQASPLYAYYTRYAPTWVWGVAAIGAALLQIGGILARRAMAVFVASVFLAGLLTMEGQVILSYQPAAWAGWWWIVQAFFEMYLGMVAGQAAPNTLAAIERLVLHARSVKAKIDVRQRHAAPRR